MRIAGTILIAALIALAANGQIVISGNEAKIDLSSGTAVVLPDAPPDSLTILDFSTFPPKVTNVANVRNSVIGPPSNIAITPDEKLALIASSTLPDPDKPGQWIPDNIVHVLDLTANPPKVIEDIKTDPQPSGMSIARDGSFALVANRAAGTISKLSINGKKVAVEQTVKVCDPERRSVGCLHQSGWDLGDRQYQRGRLSRVVEDREWQARHDGHQVLGVRQSVPLRNQPGRQVRADRRFGPGISRYRRADGRRFEGRPAAYDRLRAFRLESGVHGDQSRQSTGRGRAHGWFEYPPRQSPARRRRTIGHSRAARFDL